MKTNYNKGFGPLIVIIILAAAVGGGAYVAKKNKEAKLKANTEAQVQVNTQATAEGTAGTLRDLLALNKNVMCTVTRSDNSSNISGTAYISGGMMRGDFTTNSSTTSTMESHMIKNGNMVYVWTGTQGAKMDISQLNIDANAQANSNVNLDQKVNYACSDWAKDDAKFAVPSAVSFTDLSGLIKSQGSATGQINSTINSEAGIKASQCAACNQIPAGAAREQCKATLSCN